MSTLSVDNIEPLSGNTITIPGDLTVTGNIAGTVSGSITNAATASYVAAANVDGTVANAITASYALSSGGGGSTNTGSLLVTSSFSNPNLTFEKGDGSTFGVDISTLIVTNATSASYIDGANVDGYVNNANGADSVFTTTSMLPSGNYPILLGWPGVVDNFSGVYSKTNLSFNPSTNNLTASGSILISGSATINDVLKLEVRTTNPGTSVEGMIIASGSVGASKLYYYDGSSWVDLTA